MKLAARRADKMADDVLKKGKIGNQSQAVEDMVLQWRSSRKSEDRNRLKLNPDSEIICDTIGCTHSARGTSAQ